MEAIMRVIDADGHTLEPPGWAVDSIDPALRSRIETDEAAGGAGGRPTDRDPPSRYAGGASIHCRHLDLQERFGDIAAEGFSPAAVVRALDVEGIDVSVIYGPLYDCWIDGMDPVLACGIARAYSRWMASYSAEAAGRIVGAAPIPLHDVDLAMAEVRYTYDALGFRAFWTRPNPVSGRMLGDALFEPFFATVEELGVPLSFHEGSGSLMQNIGSERFPHTWLEQHACVHPMEQQLAMLSLIVQGVLERHPRLRLASWSVERLGPRRGCTVSTSTPNWWDGRTPRT